MEAYISINYVIKDKDIKNMLKTIHCEKDYNQMGVQDLLEDMDQNDYDYFCSYAYRNIEVEE